MSLLNKKMEVYFGSNRIVINQKLLQMGIIKILDMDSIVLILKNKLKDGH